MSTLFQIILFVVFLYVCFIVAAVGIILSQKLVDWVISKATSGKGKR